VHSDVDGMSHFVSDKKLHLVSEKSYENVVFDKKSDPVSDN
jgi:hypothetical protein